MTVRDASPHPPAAQDQGEDKHRLTALEGLAALSLDALSSVAYGPEAIVIVLAAAGTAGWTTRSRSRWPSSCCWPCWSSPTGRSSPPSRAAAARTRWPSGTWAGRPAWSPAASLTVDYVLNAAVGVSAGVAALTSAFPRLYGDRVWLCLGVLALITGVNLMGRGRVGPGVHRADAPVHPGHRHRHRQRPDPLPPGGRRRRVTCRRWPSRSASCCCSRRSPPAARR